MTLAVIAAYVLVEVPLVFAGVYLGRKWGNPSAGFWLPMLLGLLGFAIFVTGSHPATQPATQPDWEHDGWL